MGSDDSPMTRIFLTVFIFRGEADTWFNRRVLAYWSSPDEPSLFRTVRARREDEDPANPETIVSPDPQSIAPWHVEMLQEEVPWALDATYLNHVNAGIVHVPRGQESRPADIMAAVSVEGKEHQTDWNGQHFVLEGLQGIVDEGLQSAEWYEWVEGQLMDKLMEGAVG